MVSRKAPRGAAQRAETGAQDRPLVAAAGVAPANRRRRTLHERSAGLPAQRARAEIKPVGVENGKHNVDLMRMRARHALATGAPKIHHSDQGVQYAASAYVDCLHRHGVSISMAAVGKPEENGYAERLMRAIKEEEVNLSDYADFQDAYRQIGRFLDDVYSHKRIHSALGYLTPAEFHNQWTTGQLAGSSP